MPLCGHRWLASRAFSRAKGLVGLLTCLLQLLPAPQAFAVTLAEEDAYRAAFSAEALGTPLPGQGTALAFTMHYRGAVPHAAFALSQDGEGRGAWGMSSGHPSPESAAEAALRLCRGTAEAARGGALRAPCRVVAVDGRVEGRPEIPVQTGRIGPFRRSPLHLYRGPGAAQGVVVWGHGYAGSENEQRQVPLPGIVSALANAGYDVLRFDRHPGDDALAQALPVLVSGLPALRPYRRVILGGQSRGGWQALLAAAQAPALVDGVIALAPAAHGEADSESRSALALEDFRRLLAGLAEAPSRILVAVFDGDEFDPGPGTRAGIVAEIARERPVPMLAAWPQNAVRGHGGGQNWRFTRDFAGCVLTLFESPPGAAPRGLRREACGGG